MDCLRKVTWSRILLFFLTFFCASAAASQNQFTFIEYNIAFVLGLSLPVIIIAALVKPVLALKLRYLIILTATLLSMLYAMAHLKEYQSVLLLSASAIFLLMHFIWPLSMAQAVPKPLNSHLVNIGIALTVVFLVCLWFITSLDAYAMWLIFGVAILSLSAIRMVHFVKTTSISILRLVIQWGVVLGFVVSMYFWLDVQLSTHMLVIAAVIAYLVTLVNGSWILVAKTLTQISAKAEESGVQLEQLFSYSHDPSTNLPTYQHALNRFEQKLQAETEHRYAVIAFKPINFHQVNDVLGHQNSDILLLQFTYALQRHLQENRQLVNFDSEGRPTRMARLQGLHFMVAVDLAGNEHPDDVILKALCTDIANAVPEALSFKSFSLNFELNFGVSFVGVHGSTIAEVIAHAEDALLKTEKSDQWLSYYDNEAIFYTQKQLLAMEKLKQDIIHDRLEWTVQPQINIENNAIVGFELIVNWRQEDILLPLSEFIDMAEYSGEVYLMTKQSINRAFKLLATLQKLKVYQKVAVKMNSTDLLEPELVEYLATQMSKYKISAEYFLVELTEDVMQAACLRTKAMIDQLRDLGVCIAIDNFSGSYESLRYVRKVAIDQVKVNCEQIHIKSEAGTDKAIVNALLNLCSKMGVPMVATHIDTQEQSQVLASIGGQMIQGNAVDNPIEPEKMEEWINHWLNQYPHAIESIKKPQG